LLLPVCSTTRGCRRNHHWRRGLTGWQRGQESRRVSRASNLKGRTVVAVEQAPGEFNLEETPPADGNQRRRRPHPHRLFLVQRDAICPVPTPRLSHSA
jgi:hypothetical protein